MVPMRWLVMCNLMVRDMFVGVFWGFRFENRCLEVIERSD